MKKHEQDLIAPEQYELHAAPAYDFSMNRRKFFSVLGSGVAVAFTASNSLGAALTDTSTAPEDQVNAWIHIGEKGNITVYTGKAEVGQNIRTSLAQIVAEELMVPVDRISMVMGDTALTPYDRGTLGSRSIPYMGPQLRKAAATARELLVNMATEQWKADRASLAVADGVVKNIKTGESIAYGGLTKGKELLKPVDDNVQVTPVDRWQVAGTSVPKVNGVSFVTGKHQYVSDMKLPGMLYGKILRAPAYGASLVSVDVSAAKKMKDVTVVHDGDFVGVAAPSPHAAGEALKAIKAEWKTTPQPSRGEIFDYLKQKSGQANGRDSNVKGDVDNAYASADIKIAQTFYIDYIAHAPLEPRAGLAEWKDDKLTVWTGTQRPFGVQEDLQQVFHIPKENIRVIQPDTGSGYGGKHTGEAGIEAARLARDAQKPVKVVWTREEEFTWAYFRPAGVIEVKAGATKDGIVTSWEFHNYNSGGSGIETPYNVASKKIQFHPVDSPLRQGSYRGLAATANVFARESVMNDLAIELKMDPLTFRLKNLTEQRMKDVLEAAAKAFGWNNMKPAQGHGFGIACGTEKGSFVATCAEVAIDNESKEVKVIRAVTAFECGAIINPTHLENQIQGSVIQGLGGALFERIDFKEGKILNPAFSRYRVPRFSDVPIVETVMLNRKDLPSVGAGETPILGIAPAVRNAIANATGKKLYTLPLAPNGVEV
ncbi:molybdopterin-dependent oxidoreductase [Fulvivirgaceae bacterium PWU4]|uniref:Molybdopterin-dependent oxidoreductase n=1 Tax=Chryseosolibacter histidini TaxID=2782349 RepID=A0AAP2DLN1_9BACT|nr:molybdopterin cofactor-binding domain-containing protein [Chryseosolibacter histidini]MBT1697197.1 molybdopterin-dependent oxidoreductase [Chryseosolibacter histidini]